MLRSKFWDDETINRLLKEVAEEHNLEVKDVRAIISHLFLQVRTELVSKERYAKVLLHHFGSFTPKKKRLDYKIRMLIPKRQIESVKLYLFDLFKIRKKL